MPGDARYRVREAVLAKTGASSAWRVTFAAVDGSAVDQGGSNEVVIWVSPDRIDVMSFGSRYTLAEIEAFRGAGQGA